MTAFADYLDLRVAVAEWVDRRDISDVMPRFVLEAEDDLNKKLRVREMLTTGATLTFTDGIAPLPSDFVEVGTIWDATNQWPLPGGVQQVLQAWQDVYSWAIFGTNVYIYGLTGTRTMDYYAKLPTLTTTLTTSNWLLQKSPDLYKYSICAQVAKWTKSADLVGAAQGLADAEIDKLHQADAQARFGNAVIRTRSPRP